MLNEKSSASATAARNVVILLLFVVMVGCSAIHNNDCLEITLADPEASRATDIGESPQKNGRLV